MHPVIAEMLIKTHQQEIARANRIAHRDGTSRRHHVGRKAPWRH